MLLVTGGSGFLGKHLIKHLKDYLALNSGILNLRHREASVDLIRKIKPQKIIHLAADCGGIGYNLDNPASILRENLDMSLAVFEGARYGKVEEVITIGSTCQYPATLEPPFRPVDMFNGRPEESNAAYGFSKRATYEMGQSYMNQYGIKHKHIILANLYGPGDCFDPNKSHVIPALITKTMADSKTVEIWGDGRSKRELLYVEDAAEIIAKLIDTPFTGAINVGSREIHTITRIAAMIQEVLGVEKKIVYNADKPNGQAERLLDSIHFGTTPIKDGLSKTIEWYKSKYKKIPANI